MRSRPAVVALALGAVALLPGCHAGGAGGLSAKPAPALPGVSLTATEAIERHNLNAARVQALEARPRITVSSPGLNGSVDGRMALERPRNFKLQLDATMKGKVADIGSNDKGFWFWAQSKKDNNVYVCSYDELDRAPLSAAFQPDWIVEAMGLRSISREEARQMTSKGGDGPSGNIKLVSTRPGYSGETLTKETILDTSGRIKEHRLYQGQGRDRTLLASASVAEFHTFPVEGKQSVVLPYHFRLDWVPEKLTLDIYLESAKLLPTYADDVRQARFSEPDIRGTGRVNLAELAPRQPPSTSARPADPASPRTRSSRPAPSSRDSGVRLGSPEPFGVDDSARAPADPVALTADLSGPTLNPSGPPSSAIVRPALPRAVDP